MRTLVHLSDLHFGRVDAMLLDPLRDTVHALAPDLVVVSGDLTQRARRAQFAQAAAFLDALPGPQLVVPGNHDVPFYDVARRIGIDAIARRQQIAQPAPLLALLPPVEHLAERRAGHGPTALVEQVHALRLGPVACQRVVDRRHRVWQRMDQRDARHAGWRVNTGRVTRRPCANHTSPASSSAGR